MKHIRTAIKTPFNQPLKTGKPMISSDIHTSNGREVNLGLESKDCESQDNCCTDSNSHEDLISRVSCCHGAKHEALSQGEQSKEDEVVWCLPPDALTAGQGDQADQHDYQSQYPHPGVGSWELLNCFQGENTNDGHGDHQLIDCSIWQCFISEEVIPAWSEWNTPSWWTPAGQTSQWRSWRNLHTRLPPRIKDISAQD